MGHNPNRSMLSGFFYLCGSNSVINWQNFLYLFLRYVKILGTIKCFGNDEVYYG